MKMKFVNWGFYKSELTLAVLLAFGPALFMACPNPETESPASQVTGITWEAWESGGSQGTTDSASIKFWFSADPGPLNAADITINGNGAIPGALSGTGRDRTLALAMVNAQGNVAVSITKEGIAAGPKNVMLYRQTRADGSITWLVEASGHDSAGAEEGSETSGGKSTSCFKFTFSQPVDNLLASEIHLGIDGWRNLELTSNADKKIWTLRGEIVRDVISNKFKPLNAGINHTGVRSVTNTQSPKYYEAVCMGWSAIERGGTESSVNSTAIDITFDFPLSAPLSLGEVTITSLTGINADTGLAEKGGTVTQLGSEKWSVSLAGVAATGTVTVHIQKAGVFRWGIAENAANNQHYSKKVTVYSALAANDFTVEQVGGASGAATTTAIKISFNRAVTSLADSDVLITGNGGSANVVGTPTTADNTVWTVPVTVGLQGSIKVKIQPRPGMTGAEKTVTVYKEKQIKTNESGNPDLETYLAGLASNTASSPAAVRLHSSVTVSEDWALVDRAVRTAAKYIILDLSACPDTSISGRDAQGSPAPSGNDFNIIRNNHYIKGIILPANLTVIGNSAFDTCDNLTQIGNMAGELRIPSRITQIGTMAFRGINNIATLVFEPRSGAALSIGASAFTTSDNAGRTTDFSGPLVLPVNTTLDGSSVFQYRRNFTSLEIGEGCQTIPANAFRYCQGLATITIPASVTSIGTTAFGSIQTYITAITIKASGLSFASTGLNNGSAGSGTSSIKALYEGTVAGIAGGPGTYTRPSTSSNVWTFTPLP